MGLTPNQLLTEMIADEILKVADSADDLTRSDLQGVASVAAMKIISLVGKQKASANDSPLTVLEVNLNEHFDYDTPEALPEWQWIQEHARFAHCGNGDEDGVWEFMIYLSFHVGPEASESKKNIPDRLRPFFAQAEACGAVWILFYQA